MVEQDYRRQAFTGVFFDQHFWLRRSEIPKTHPGTARVSSVLVISACIWGIQARLGDVVENGELKDPYP